MKSRPRAGIDRFMKIERMALAVRFFVIWEIAASRPRMQMLELFQTLAEVRAVSGRFLQVFAMIFEQIKLTKRQ